MSQYVNIASISNTHASLKDGQPAAKSVYVRGMVIDKNSSKDNFFSYVIADREDPDHCFKAFAKKSKYLRLDCATFEEMHDDVEVGDYVSIIGLPARSKNGNLYLDMQYISVITYGNNEYETESESEDEEECTETDYDSEESEEEFDSETETEESEDEDFESDSEDEFDDVNLNELQKVSSDYLPKFSELTKPNFEIPEIPMKIYNHFVDYRGHYFKIGGVRVTTPGKLVVSTKIGELVFTKMAHKFMGVYIPANGLELSFKNGYDLIVGQKFSDLLETLY